MVDVLLINPPYPFWEGVPVSLSLTYLGAVLEEEGYEVECLDLLVSSYSPGKVKRKVRKLDPEIVGITSVTRTYPVSIDILKHCKDVDSELKTVIGGPHVTFTYEETLEEAPWIDFVVVGEGEYTFRDLTFKIFGDRNYSSVEGLAFEEGGEVIFTGERDLIQDLDELPFPDRKLLPLSKYRALDSRCGVITSRGCPFGCVFCVASGMFGEEVRFRSSELIVDEIEEILNLGFQVNFADDTFTLNHDHVYGVLDEIQSRGLEFDWSANARVDTINRDLLKRMKEAGCKTIFFGVESGNPEVLEKSGKAITHDEVEEAVNLAKDVGLDIITSYILGLPGDTEETLQQTLDYANELDTPHTIHVLAPLPGTPVYEDSEDYGIRLISEEWEEVNADNPVTEVITDEGIIGPEELESAKQEYLKRSGDSMKECKEDAAAGDEEAKKKLEKWKKLEFVTNLLENDLIEKNGKFEIEKEDITVEESINILAERLSRYFDDIDFSLESQIRYQLEEGNLENEILEEEEYDLLWRWAEV